MPSIDENRTFWSDKHEWPAQGDEWSDQAAHSNVPYAEWKDALVRTFLEPNLRPGSVVLEIAPGHGRWTRPILQLLKQGKCIAVDVSPSCIDFCRETFQDPRLELHVNDGHGLPMVANDSIDFAFSFDSFVHIEPADTDSYLGELSRVLKPGGRGCIHHPGQPSEAQRTRASRSMTTATAFAGMVSAHGLRLLSQVDSWGEGNRCTTKLFADCISIFERPASLSSR